MASQNDDSLLILDITSPAQPWPVTIMYDDLRGVEALNGATDIEVLKTEGRVYALVAGKWDDGIQILDITDPTDPDPVTAVFDNTDGYLALRGATDIEVAPVSDRIIAVVSGAFDDAVQFIDVTDPTQPRAAARRLRRLGRVQVTGRRRRRGGLQDEYGHAPDGDQRRGWSHTDNGACPPD